MSWHVIAAAAAAIAIRYKPSGDEPARAKPFVGASPHALEMQPLPIEPSWVLTGNPQARAAAHSKGEDGLAATGVWDCTAGSFRWYFGWDETVVILEGSVHITAEDGTARLLAAGDVGYFKAGTWATWQVDDYVKKVAFLRKPYPKPIAMLYQLRAAFRPRPKVGLAG
ncbi:MAG: cupin domain-containing protein [Neorhizobium sp.]|jgi:uncharacterized cupin superfamily protein|nr:cupin domain-containing protein [Neorhizobium sp.]